MTESMVERVARAICVAEGLDWDEQCGLTSGNGDPDAQEAYLMLAKAAIAAMREPTEAMVIGGVCAMDLFSESPEPVSAAITGQPKDIWQSMIDKALE